MSDKLFLLKISLEDSKPEIWRRFVVPADTPLDRLHDVIQIVMGWTDCHLHEFSAGKRRFTENSEGSEQGEEEAFFRLNELIKRKGQYLHYLYDFGDNWLHKVTIEDSNFSFDDASYPVVCIDGAGMCPPEDVGGIHGYYQVLEIIKDPIHEDYSETREWLTGASETEEIDIDPDAFDTMMVNGQLFIYGRWARDRILEWFEEDE